MTLPFYAGCPNASEYFPEESFIPIDIRNPESAAETILKAIKDHDYEKRLLAIQEARKRVLFKHNLIAVIAREIEMRHDPNRIYEDSTSICSRHAVRAKSPLNGFNDILGKVYSKLRHFEL